MARECAGLVSDVDFNGAGGGLASLLLGDYQRPVTRLDLRLFQGVEVLALDVEPWTVSIFRDIEKIARHLRSVAGVGLQLADKGCGHCGLHRLADYLVHMPRPIGGVFS